jgi:DNA-binding transcriptional LysR family regulator
MVEISGRGDLNQLTIFVRVAELGSFSAAAKSLGIPVSTASRKLAELEARLGVNLIKRTTRKLNLSEHGLCFYESCAPHLQGLEDAEAGLTNASTALEGTLRVSAPVALGRGEFTDFMSRFSRQHPELRIELTITNQFVDLVATQVDVAIRFGKLADSGVVARRLGVSRRTLVASPDYLKQRGTPRSPQDLPAHDCVLFRGESGDTEWTLLDGRRRARVRVTGSVSANNLESVNELALRGHGIALLPEPYALLGAATGSLQRILPRWRSVPIPVQAVYLNRKFLPAKLATFLAELASYENSTWQKDQ